MNYPNDLTSARQRAGTSKEAGDHSMVVKPQNGSPETPECLWQGAECKVKATLPEPQIETGGSHPLPTPDKGQALLETHSLRLGEAGQPEDGASNKLVNDRTRHPRIHHHHYSRTTGSPKQDSRPAWRRSLHSTQCAGVTPGAIVRKGTVAATEQPSSNRRESRPAVGEGRQFEHSESNA